MTITEMAVVFTIILLMLMLPAFFWDRVIRQMLPRWEVDAHRVEIDSRLDAIEAKIEAGTKLSGDSRTHEDTTNAARADDPDEGARRLWEAGRQDSDPSWDQMGKLEWEVEVDGSMSGVSARQLANRMRRMYAAGVTAPEEDK